MPVEKSRMTLPLGPVLMVWPSNRIFPAATAGAGRSAPDCVVGNGDLAFDARNDDCAFGIRGFLRNRVGLAVSN